MTKTANFRLNTFRTAEFGVLGHADPDGKVAIHPRPTGLHTIHSEFEPGPLADLPRVSEQSVGREGVGHHAAALGLWGRGSPIVNRVISAMASLRAVLEIARREGIRDLLELRGIATAEKGIGALLIAEAGGAEPAGHPVVLIQTDAGGERKVRAHPDKEAAPLAVVDVEVVVENPPLAEGQVPAVVGGLAIGEEDPGGLAGLEDDDGGVGAGPPEVRFDEGVLAPLRRVEDRHLPRGGTLPEERLTPREREVLQLVAEGNTTTPAPSGA